MEAGQDELVLHEGDGKIRQPSTFKNDGKGGLKMKKMPSPRKVTPTETSNTAGAASKPSKKVVSMSEKTEGKNDNGNTKMPSNVSFDADFDEGDSVFEDWDEDDRRSRNFQESNKKESLHSKKPSFELTTEDLEICQRLDDEYERALEERDIGYNARYSSVRQTAMWSIFFLALYMIQGKRELLLLNNQQNYIAERAEGEEDEFDNEFSSWSIPESLFFSIFTITTVGYGREDLPATPSFQAYTIAYIMVGIAALTIMVAQVYQCIALEASRARLSQDKQDELRRRSGLMLKGGHRHKLPLSSPTGSSTHGGKNGPERQSDDEIIITSYVQTGLVPRTVECCFRHLDRARYFFRETEIGKGISVVFPFAGLILSGATVVWLLEGWTFLESLYFAVVSLTTVGFGDYVPTKLPTIWFCIFWLPFSIGFMSMYLSNVATFYIRLSDRNIRRIERNLRRRLQKAKEKAEEERAEILRRAYRGQEIEIEIAAGSADRGNVEDMRTIQRTGSTDSNASEEYKHATIPKNHARSVMRRQKQKGFNILPIADDDDNSDDETVLIGGGMNSDNAKVGDVGRRTGHRRRQQIIENCRANPSSSDSSSGDNEDGDLSNARTMKSMKDVISAVRSTMDSMKDGTGHHPVNPGENDASKFMSIRSTQNMIDYSIFRRQNQSKKPSFALRVLIQERFAKIIAMEVAGFHSSIEIKDQTLSVTIESISDTAEKWSIPRRARKAFRAVAFEILYFVGEHGLITRGADALFELTPFEFHGLFSTLVAAMGDADIMEGWLANTDALAMVDLQQAVLHRSAPDDEGRGGLRKRVFSID
eukprot:CAMPEP_0116151970 /NCGR_PEP_ID=MMETSP0329-20121206/20394_1 /TAXON_ID=697910 /ORGANISM="Pseudo-nitzschia arenysensis, Strain B593" /LENGTH=819 /DNA_ID=CAMNT_0003648645 /DNA_START=217 /DNA_END=2677 /DNA_ORIENTATION=+